MKRKRRSKKRARPRANSSTDMGMAEKAVPGQVYEKCSYASGTVYEGFMVSGKRHGQGICIDENGNKFEGIWVYDEANG